jgi:hypothetical protein
MSESRDSKSLALYVESVLKMLKYKPVSKILTAISIFETLMEFSVHP